ncbi:MAG: phosphoribosylamine--glycine ligase [Tissierellaceae bacterium]|nr:phosphoribosylamine--glycine ligase [Tissierellaceae bacterium]
MKILVIGSGGREHALCWKIAQSPRVKKIYCAPGNGGTREVGQNIDIQVDDIQGLLGFALEKKIDLTVVGPELPLVMGIVDTFQKKGLKIFGVNKKSAQLEGSKDFSKGFMKKHDIPTAKYETYENLDEALRGLKEFSYPLVVKADGLCAGKGVVICQNEKEAVKALEDILEKKVFGDQGNKVVVEEFLDGVEASLLCFVSNGKIIPMESAKDYKKIYDGDKGPNTGGVGCYSPSPLFTEEFMTKIHNVLENIEIGLLKENMDFRGVLFIGLMIVKGEPKVLEFNVRFGDPETEVLLPRLESDIVDLFEKTIDNTLKEADLKWKDHICLTVIATSEGYPGDYKMGFEIYGIDRLDEEIILFHNGTKYLDGKTFTMGGRVLSITALGETLDDARDRVYSSIEGINFRGMNFRKDIGKTK